MRNNIWLSMSQSHIKSASTGLLTALMLCVGSSAVAGADSGAFWKWYSDKTIAPDFSGYQAQRFMGGKAGAVTGAQMIPGDFNGDGVTDMLIFSP